MTTDQTILPYAGRQQHEGGLAPGTLLAIYAIAAAVSHSAFLVRILPLQAKFPLPEYGALAVRYLIATVLLAAGGGLALSRVGWGRWFVLGACAADLLGGQVLELGGQLAGWLITGIGKPWRDFSTAETVVTLMRDLFEFASACALLWLLWHLVRNASPALPRGQIRWRSIARSAHCFIVVAGGIELLRALIGVVWQALTAHTIEPAQIVPLATGGLMLAAGVGGLAKWQWTTLVCTVALVAWWLTPPVRFILLEMTRGRLAAAWAFSRRLFLPSLDPVALLLVLLVLHPRIRQANCGEDQLAAA